MENYIKVDVTKYVKQGIENGTMKLLQAEEVSRIIVRQGIPGETVISWSVDVNGNEVKEKIAQVTIDELTQEAGWIATKVNENGEPIIDNNKHLNNWIIDDSTFKKKYEIDPENPNLCKSKGVSQTFVEIPDNIILNQWGEDMAIAAGGYINITNPNDMYGISKRDFEDTYKYTD